MAYLQSIDIEAKEVLQFLTLSIYIISQNNLGEVIAAWYALWCHVLVRKTIKTKHEDRGKTRTSFNF